MIRQQKDSKGDFVRQRAAARETGRLLFGKDYGMKKAKGKSRRVIRRTDPHHLCFQVGNKYYLLNLMEGKVEEGSVLGSFMQMINAEMKHDMKDRAAFAR